MPLSTKLEFKFATRVAVDPVTIAGVAILAGIQQVGDKPTSMSGAPKFVLRKLTPAAKYQELLSSFGVKVPMAAFS